VLKVQLRSSRGRNHSILTGINFGPPERANPYEGEPEGDGTDKKATGKDRTWQLQQQRLQDMNSKHNNTRGPKQRHQSK